MIARIPVVAACLLGMLQVTARAEPPAGAAVAAPPDDASAWTELPVRFRQGLIHVNAKIGDRDDLWFVMDTGASATYLSEAVLDAIPGARRRLEHLRKAQAEGAHVWRYLPRQAIDVGTGEIVIRKIWIADEEKFDWASDPPAHGLLGLPYFKSRVVRISYRDATVSVRPADGFALPPGYERLPITLTDSSLTPSIDAGLSMAGEEPAKLTLALDLGSATGILMESQAFERRGWTGLGRTQDTIRYHPWSGPDTHAVHECETLRIGSALLPGAPVETTARSIDGAKEIDGIIGARVLSRFDIIVNFTDGYLAVKPHPATLDPFFRWSLGINAILRPEEGVMAVRVHSLDENSPAREAGLEVGDRLLAIGDVDLTAGKLARERVKETLDADDVTVRASRDGEEFEVQVTPARSLRR